MIVEMQTILLKPKTPKAVEDRFASSLPARNKNSPLGAFWHTEVGLLNQVILLWPYASLEERERVQTESATAKNWPPDIREFTVSEDTMILKPAPFSPPLEPRKLGDIYDIRCYTYQRGTIPIVIERWAPKMAERTRLSPLAGCWYTDIGPQHKWVQIWAYPDAAERQRVRAEALARKIWPPDTAEYIVKMENMLAIPAPFSPLH
jgi:hypothetical protein